MMTRGEVMGWLVFIANLTENHYGITHLCISIRLFQKMFRGEGKVLSKFGYQSPVG